MRSSGLKAITPVWAQRIEVERKKDALLITGWGHIPNPLSTQQVPPEKHSKLDILQRLRRYALRQLGQSRGNAGVYQFGDATDDEKLFAFASEFGPVSGEVKKFKPESNGTWTLTVRETLESLHHERKQFASLVQIVQQVNLNALADFGVLRQLLIDLEMDIVKGWDWFRGMEDLVGQSFIPSKSVDLLAVAHSALCLRFSIHCPKLAHVDGQVIELPDVDFSGIRNAIYYQLRRDYLAQREIGICLECGNHFSVFKHGSRACSDPCRRALRNRAYWGKHKQTINRKRREIGGK